MKKKPKKSLLKRLSSIDDIKANFVFTRDLLKNKSKVSKKERIKEDFNSALRRLSIMPENEESHLTKVYSKLKVTFFSYFISSICVSILTTYQIIEGINLGYLYYASYLIGAALLMKSFESSFRCYQIRIRELGGLSNFFKKPKEWYPVKYNYSRKDN